MDRDETVDLLRQHAADMRRFGVVSLAVFGPVARNEAATESDVDVLVHFSGPSRFDDYMGLEFFLEDLLGRPVDVVPRSSLKPRLEAAVEREAVRVA